MYALKKSSKNLPDRVMRTSADGRGCEGSNLPVFRSTPLSLPAVKLRVSRLAVTIKLTHMTTDGGEAESPLPFQSQLGNHSGHYVRLLEQVQSK